MSRHPAHHPYLWVAVLVTVLLAGCTSGARTGVEAREPGRTEVEAEETPQSRPTQKQDEDQVRRPNGVDRRPVTLTIQQQTARSDAAYFEGSLTYVVVRHRLGFVVGRFTSRGPRSARFELEVSPGRYRLESGQRPCGGGISCVDEPVDRCHTKLRLTQDTELVLVERVGTPCIIR